MAFAVLLVVGAAGCASSVVRDATKETAGNVTSVSQELSRYQSALESDAAKKINRLAALRTQLAALNAGYEERLAIWELLGEKDALRMLNGVMELRDEATRVRTELNQKGAS